MAQPALSIEQARDCIERVEVELRAGFRPPGMTGSGRGAVAMAAERAVADGLMSARQTFVSRMDIIKDRFRLEPDWTLYRHHRLQQPSPRSVIVHADESPPRVAEFGQGKRVLVIGDLHQDPRHPHRMDVLAWIARYASEHRFDHIVQIGDWGTFDSVNTHEDNRTLKARLKPSIRDDLDNLKSSLNVFQRNKAQDYKPRLTFTTGNHENRLERFENVNPESQGMFTLAREEAFLQHGWKTRPYGELFYVENVAFTHHPTSAAGRAFGGKTGPQRGANETTVAMVSGHTHKRQLYDTPKIGPVDVLSMIEVGCALPWGEVESYVGVAPTGWWWGVAALTVADGMAPDVDFVSMQTLRARYSDDGAAVKAA